MTTISRLSLTEKRYLSSLVSLCRYRVEHVSHFFGPSCRRQWSRMHKIIVQLQLSHMLNGHQAILIGYDPVADDFLFTSIYHRAGRHTSGVMPAPKCPCINRWVSKHTVQRC